MEPKLPSLYKQPHQNCLPEIQLSVNKGRIKEGGGGGGGGCADWTAAMGPTIFRGPPKIVHKIFLEKNKISYTLDRILYGIYLRACSDGSFNHYHDLYLHCHMLSLTHSECRMNRLTITFYGIILHYYMQECPP